MSLWPATFRILLSLALVANGLGGAVAATRMHAAPANHGHEATARQTPAEEMPCHQGIEAGSSSHDAMPPGAGTPGDVATAPECCQGAVCSCACVFQAQTMVLGPAFPTEPWVGSAVAERLLVEHADAAVPHLIRPPIG